MPFYTIHYCLKLVSSKQTCLHSWNLILWVFPKLLLSVVFVELQKTTIYRSKKAGNTRKFRALRLGRRQERLNDTGWSPVIAIN